MKKIRFLTIAAAMVLALIGGPLLPGSLPSTAAQKTIPPECVESCRQLMFDCMALGEKENCLGVYHRCIAHCKK